MALATLTLHRLNMVLVVKKTSIFMIIMLVIFSMKLSNCESIPALFILGDSLVDVGNNNHLTISIAKANLPHNGIDFPTHQPTGRFSNGKNAADFLAEKLGLPSSPPYLHLTHVRSNNFSGGVSFASGGAGIFDGTDKRYRQSVTMNQQVQYFTSVQAQIVQQMGASNAKDFLSKSVYMIVIGSNDILGQFGDHLNLLNQDDPQEFVSSMVLAIQGQLKKIYDLGARKFVVAGVPAVGCTPAQRVANETDDCNETANFWTVKYNQGLASVLAGFKSELQGFQYSYINSYDLLLHLVQQPDSYGFKEVKAACCGLGKLNAVVPCLPISTYCSNRNDHVFWDLYHPTEAADRIFIDLAFNGPEKYVFPVNIHQLVSS